MPGADQLGTERAEHLCGQTIISRSSQFLPTAVLTDVGFHHKCSSASTPSSRQFRKDSSAPMTHRSVLSTALILVLTLCLIFQTALAQVQLPDEPLTNSQIVEMVKAKLSAEAIITKIQVSRCHFDTNPTILAELKFNGADESDKAHRNILITAIDENNRRQSIYSRSSRRLLLHQRLGQQGLCRSQYV